MPPKEVTLKDMLKNNPPPLDANASREETDSRYTIHTDTTVPSSTDTVKSVVTYNLKSTAGDREQTEYYVIIESATNQDLARQKAEKLKKEFRVDFIILPPTRDGYYRISYGKYSTMEEARSAISGIRKNIRSDAWIFTLKK
jgi:septal ring-binding cell division protein DamX